MTAEKNLDSNSCPCSGRKYVGIQYGMPKSSKKTVVTLVEVTVMTRTAVQFYILVCEENSVWIAELRLG